MSGELRRHAIIPLTGKDYCYLWLERTQGTKEGSYRFQYLFLNEREVPGLVEVASKDLNNALFLIDNGTEAELLADRQNKLACVPLQLLPFVPGAKRYFEKINLKTIGDLLMMKRSEIERPKQGNPRDYNKYAEDIEEELKWLGLSLRPE